MCEDKGKKKKEDSERINGGLERVSVCRRCGVAGFAELLFFCKQCQVSAEHCYCLDESPDNDADFTWTCEECVPRVISSLNKVTLHPTRKSERINTKRERAEMFRKLKKRQDKNCTAAETELHRCDVAFTQQPLELCTKDVLLEPALLRTDFSLQTEESRSSNICEDTNEDRELKRQRRRLILEEGEISDEDAEYEQAEQMRVDSDVGDAPKSMLQVKPDLYDSSKSLVLSYASVGAHALPIVEPVWRGSFDISNGRYGRVVAHLSNKACLKVWEGAKGLSMLPLLCADMLSRLDAWPKTFSISAPTDDNIALYFFPESERDFENFTELVNEMIDLDLALKVVLDNAELLIFPSDQLPQQCWRFGGRYYLWGVFRGRKNPVPAKPAEPLLICDKAAECMGEARNSSTNTWRMTSPRSPLSTASSYGIR